MPEKVSKGRHAHVARGETLVSQPADIHAEQEFADGVGYILTVDELEENTPKPAKGIQVHGDEVDDTSEVWTKH
jgi:hypothetical protein